MKSIVSSISIDSYDSAKLEAAIHKLLDPLGRINRFVKPGMTVLINPNLLSARKPEKAVTTHPELVAAVSALCIKAGAEVIIGDSPGGVEKGLKRVWDNTGMTAAAEMSKARLVGFESGRVKEAAVDGRKYYISRYAYDVDLIISLPKLKTHVLTNYTGAIKNCYGFIPGLRKSDYHRQNPDVKSFSSVVVDIFSSVKPALFIMDAGLVMEGDGPASGDTRWLGYLLASTDGVALDASVAATLGIGKRRVWTTEFAAQRGLGQADLSQIEVLGEAFRAGAVDRFKWPSNAYMNLIPSTLAKTLAAYFWVRPAIDQKTCTKCGECVINCPQEVIYETDDGLRFDYDKCIKCMCCHELCPYRSIYLERSRLARLLGK